jgi:hypothetical protein
VWKRHDHYTEKWWGLDTLWPRVEVIDFSGCSLTSIGESSFINSLELMEVILPNTVTELCRGSFYRCASLKVVKVGNGLNILGEEAFWFCGNLIEIVLPDTVTEVGVNAFSGTSLKTLSLGEFAGYLNRANWSVPATAKVVIRGRV